MSSSSVTNFTGPAMLIAFCLCCSSSSALLAGPFSGLFDILKTFFEAGGGAAGAAGEAAAAAASGAGDLLNAVTGNRNHQPMSQERLSEIATGMQSSCFPCAPFGDEMCNETKTTTEQGICAGVIDTTCTNDPSFHEYCPKYIEVKPNPNVRIDLSIPNITASERNRTYTAEECFQCGSKEGECSEAKINSCEPTVKNACLTNPDYYNTTTCYNMRKLKII